MPGRNATNDCGNEQSLCNLMLTRAVCQRSFKMYGDPWLEPLRGIDHDEHELLMASCQWTVDEDG